MRAGRGEGGGEGEERKRKREWERRGRGEGEERKREGEGGGGGIEMGRGGRIEVGKGRAAPSSEVHGQQDHVSPRPGRPSPEPSAAAHFPSRQPGPACPPCRGQGAGRSRGQGAGSVDSAGAARRAQPSLSRSFLAGGRPHAPAQRPHIGRRLCNPLAVRSGSKSPHSRRPGSCAGCRTRGPNPPELPGFRAASRAPAESTEPRDAAWAAAAATRRAPAGCRRGAQRIGRREGGGGPRQLFSGKRPEARTAAAAIRSYEMSVGGRRVGLARAGSRLEGRGAAAGDPARSAALSARGSSAAWRPRPRGLRRAVRLGKSAVRAAAAAGRNHHDSVA